MRTEFHSDFTIFYSVPITLSLVEVLALPPYSPAPDLFRLHIDYLAHVIVLVLIMACTIPDLIATVVTESHGFSLR